MDDIVVTTGKRKKKRKPETNPIMSHRRGLRVGYINTHGLVSDPDKRIDLNHWMVLNDLDIVCIQEWFVPHGKQTRSEIDKRNNNNSNNNNNNKNNLNNLNDLNDLSSSDDDYDCNVNIERFEDEKKNDSRYLEISLDMTAFPKYEKIETNTKTYHVAEFATVYLQNGVTVLLVSLYSSLSCVSLLIIYTLY